jgi:transposase InsO family protein
METISRSTILGLIVLALRCLTRLKIPGPRIVAGIAKALGLSRKAGYEAANRILAMLTAAAEPAEKSERDRELLLLRIKNQVLCFERDHGIRFDQGAQHLSELAKTLCVKILREFRDRFSAQEIATTIGVPDSSLLRWEKEALPDGSFPVKPERRGQHRHAGPEDEQRVIALFNELRSSKTLEEFAREYRTRYPDAPLDRCTITKILRQAGLVEVAPPKAAPPEYHGKIAVYFPGAQIAVDGKDMTVHFTTEPEAQVTVNREVAIDIASGAILGTAVGRHETADGVKTVVIEAAAECRNLLATLADNRSTNTCPEAQQTMADTGEVGSIFTFPYHAETNGKIEGLFGQFSRVVGPIEIDDSSRESIARSVEAIVWRIFRHSHNYSPRQALGGKSPIDYLRTYTVLPEELEAARKGLGAQQERSRASRGPHPRLADPAFCRLVQSILKTHGFDLPLDEALNALVRFDHVIIEHADAALVVACQRDGFDKRKHHFAYFMGIVRNKQKELDKARLESRLDHHAAQAVLDGGAAQDAKIAKEEQEERKQLATEPEKIIIKYAQTLMQARFRLMRDKWLARIREGLEALRRLGRTTRIVLENLTIAIHILPDFAEEVKEHMSCILAEEFAAVMGT